MASADKILWRRSCGVEAVEDERARFLDPWTFREGRLDPDERERVAEWLQRHPDEAMMSRRRERSRAPPGRRCYRKRSWRVPVRSSPRPCQADKDAPSRRGVAVRVPGRADRKPVLGTIAQWGSLAAALVVAGWLGFTLGMDTSGMLAPGGAPDTKDGVAQDLFGSSPAFLAT